LDYWLMKCVSYWKAKTFKTLWEQVNQTAETG
jgi:hypothetical protein